MRTYVWPLAPLLVVSIFTVASASAVTILGHGRLLGSATTRVDYDSNIFVSHSEISDMIGTFSGGVRYLRDASEVTFDATAAVDAYAFADHNELNSIDPRVAASFGYNPSEKTSLQARFELRRDSIGNEFLNDRTRSNDFVFDSSGEQLFSEKLGLRATATYTKNSYITTGYSDVENYGLGLQGVYIYSPKLKLLAGATALESWTNNRPTGRRSPSNRDWRYTVGAEGELASKVTGEVSVGVVDREFDGPGFNSTSALYLSSRVTWAATEKTSWSLRAGQNLSLSAADQSVKAFDASLTLTQEVAQKVKFEGSVGLDHTSFTSFAGTGNRTDDGAIFRARFDFAIKENLAVDVSAGYRNNDSSLLVATYGRFTCGVGVTYRF